MDKKLFYVLGAIFIIVSGVIYTIERGMAYYTWIGQMTSHTGGYPTNPQMPGLLTNVYIPIFIIIGLVFYILGYRKK